MNCIYNHTCIRCGRFHPLVHCPQSVNFRNPASYTLRPPNPVVRYPSNVRAANPSVQPFNRTPRPGRDIRFRPHRFPGQQLSLPKLQY